MINKFLKFEELFSSLDRKEIKYTLVYCSDKFHEQLDHVNDLMRKLKVKYHQVTSQETSDKILLKNILDEFSDGKTKQVLTSMRVLDEGVNIPQISTAYILASTTVKRQWVQRRGRVLRTCDDIGKRRAYLHDFLVLPSINDEFSKNLIQSELERVTEFGELSLNFNDSDGAYTIIDNLME